MPGAAARQNQRLRLYEALSSWRWRRRVATMGMPMQMRAAVGATCDSSSTVPIEARSRGNPTQGWWLEPGLPFRKAVADSLRAKMRHSSSKVRQVDGPAESPIRRRVGARRLGIGATWIKEGLERDRRRSGRRPMEEKEEKMGNGDG